MVRTLQITYRAVWWVGLILFLALAAHLAMRHVATHEPSPAVIVVPVTTVPVYR